MRHLERERSSDNLIQVIRPADPLIARINSASIRERQALILEERLLDLADQAQGRLALDLEAVEQITSAGINALINAQNRCAKHGAKLVLARVSRDIEDLLKITGLNRMLLVVNHPDDAVHYFKTHRAATQTNKRSRHAA